MRTGDATSTPARNCCRLQLVAALCAALGALAAAWPLAAVASPCCSSVVAFGGSRLAAWERGAVGLQLGGSHELGWWDDAGRLHRLGPGIRQDALSAELWGLAALSSSLQLSVALPWQVGLRSAPGVDAVGSAPGDVRLGLRAELVAIGARPGWPGIAVVGSLVVPTGTRAEQAKAALGADASGRGAFRPGLGVVVEGAVGDAFWRGDLGLVVPAPFRREDRGSWQRDGVALGLGATAGAQFGPWVLSATGRWQGEAAYHDRGAEVAGSERWISQLGVGIGLRLGPEWIVAASVAGNPLGRAVGARNESEIWRAGLSVRRAIVD